VLALQSSIQRSFSNWELVPKISKIKSKIIASKNQTRIRFMGAHLALENLNTNKKKFI